MKPGDLVIFNSGLFEGWPRKDKLAIIDRRRADTSWNYTDLNGEQGWNYEKNLSPAALRISDLDWLGRVRLMDMTYGEQVEHCKKYSTKPLPASIWRTVVEKLKGEAFLVKLASGKRVATAQVFICPYMIPLCCLIPVSRRPPLKLKEITVQEAKNLAKEHGALEPTSISWDMILTRLKGKKIVNYKPADRHQPGCIEIMPFVAPRCCFELWTVSCADCDTGCAKCDPDQQDVFIMLHGEKKEEVKPEVKPEPKTLPGWDQVARGFCQGDWLIYKCQKRWSLKHPVLAIGNLFKSPEEAAQFVAEHF